MALTMMPAYILAYCRAVIGLLFLISSISKVRDVTAFKLAIRSFALLPVRLEKSAAIIFIVAEFMVVLLMLIGGFFLFPGFLLAIFLLLLFSSVLGYALTRKLSASCNCFGSSNKSISSADLSRNAGLLLLAIIGGGVSTGISGGNQRNIGLLEWVLVVVGASFFTVAWIHVGEVVQFFRQN